MQIATNVLVAIGTVFLAIQLVRIYTPPADPVAIDSPLAGEWAMLAGGRSALISHHYPTPIVSKAVDFVRLDEEGRGHDGDRKREKAWYGFGEPVLSPADGTVVSVSDVHPDEPVGNTGQKPSYGNHILLDIGGGHYAVLAHLQQGSARVSEGERVRLGQQIAAVGDSGDSLVPHLHFQVQDSPTSVSRSVRFRSSSATSSSSGAEGSRRPRRLTSGAATTSDGLGTDLVSQHQESLPTRRDLVLVGLVSAAWHMPLIFLTSLYHSAGTR